MYNDDESMAILDELEINPSQPTRTVIKVLCILTWIGSFVFLLYGNMGVVLGEYGVPIFDKTKINWDIHVFLITVFSPVCCAFGAFLMWRNSKWGFICYLIGQLIPITYLFYYFLSIVGAIGVSIVVPILISILPILFCVLYAMQLKTMHWSLKKHD